MLGCFERDVNVDEVAWSECLSLELFMSKRAQRPCLYSVRSQELHSLLCAPELGAG